MACGIHCGLATGRIPGPWSDEIRSAVPGLGASVFANGGLVVDANGEVVAEAVLPQAATQAVRLFTERGRARGGGRLAVLAATRWSPSAADSTPVIEAANGRMRYIELAPDGVETFCTELIRNAGEPATRVTELPLEMPDVCKFVMFTNPDDPEWAEMPEVIDALRTELCGTGAVVLDCGAKQCEVFAPGVNKGAGVARLLSHLGVAPEEALALGDAENDVEMLRLVGVGVAMGNANAAAKAAADVVVATSDNDGVAEAVRRFALGGERAPLSSKS